MRVMRECAWAGVLAAAVVTVLGAGRQPAETGAPAGLPKGPVWGGGSFQPRAANTVFATGDGCSLCHSASANAGALWSSTGEDVSPHGLWQATMMANSARDPYWRAQVAKEASLYPERAAELEALCVRCHTPMGHHTQKIAGEGALRVAAAAAHPLYGDGVSCTVCHQIQAEGLGTEARFSGNVEIRPGRKIFGPYADPGGQPMIVHSAFTPTQGEHIRSSALCAGCHTLRTEHTHGGAGAKFPEQSPFLEWRNSVYSDEKGVTATSRSCQECHMAEVGPMRVARNPAGFDFNIATRDPVRAHAFVGGNAAMLDLLRVNAAKLGVTAPAAALERMARATRQQLSHKTAKLAVENQRREVVDGTSVLVFDLVVTNLCGHKFPTGYPSRRAWVQVQVRDGRTNLFTSGEVDERGRIKGVADELAVRHRDVVESAEQVVVYEMVAAGVDGKATTSLGGMARRMKDTRLLPAGYDAKGPHGEDTGPVGIEGDGNFVGGSDRITYRVELPAGTGGAAPRLTIVAWLWYQTMPPAWVDSLRGVEAAEAKEFVAMHDAMKFRPEQVAVTVAFEPVQ
jgi:hypothetical protein